MSTLDESGAGPSTHPSKTARQPGVGTGHWARHGINTRGTGMTLAEDEFFHGTPTENLDSIFTSGLLAHYKGIRTTTGEPYAELYVTVNDELALHAGAIASLMHDEGKFSVLKVRADVSNAMPDVYTSTGTILKQSIPPQNILQVQRYRIKPEVLRQYNTELSNRGITAAALDWEDTFHVFKGVKERFPDAFYEQIHEAKREEGNALYSFVIGDDGHQTLMDFYNRPPKKSKKRRAKEKVDHHPPLKKELVDIYKDVRYKANARLQQMNLMRQTLLELGVKVSPKSTPEEMFNLLQQKKKEQDEQNSPETIIKDEHGTIPPGATPAQIQDIYNRLVNPSPDIKESGAGPSAHPSKTAREPGVGTGHWRRSIPGGGRIELTKADDTYVQPRIFWDQYMKEIREGKIPRGARPPDRGSQTWEARRKLWDEGMYAIVDQDLGRNIAAKIGDRPTLEVMAGRGWLAKAMAENGVNVIATDDQSWMRGPDARITKPPVYPVKDMDAVTAINAHPEAQVMVMSWPPYDEPHAYNAAKAWGPERPIVYIGMDKGGPTANDDFFDHFDEVDSFGLVTLAGNFDSVHIGYYKP